MERKNHIKEVLAEEGGSGRIDNLRALVDRFLQARSSGQLHNSSEATIRTWIDDLLKIFGWDVHNTNQILTEHSLGRTERAKLRQIGSSNIRPDYTFVNGSVALAFLDAKSPAVNIQNDKDAAFQIRSYGWSIGAPFSIVTNFQQLAIYDCSIIPHVDEEANFAQVYFFTCDQFVANYEILKKFLLRTNLLAGDIKFAAPKGNALDERFSKILGDTRLELARSILRHNDVDNVNTLSFYVQTIIDRILFIRVCESRGLETDGLLRNFAESGFWENFKNCSYADFYDRYDGPMFRRILPLQSLSIGNDVFRSFIKNLYYPSPYRFDVIPLKTLSDIYDLFLSYHLIVINGDVTDELRTEFKKSNGAVTTPESIVQQVIKSTMQKTTMEKLCIQQILALKVADIACGSGAFLIGVYDYLSTLIEDKLASDTSDNSIGNIDFVEINGRKTLTIKGRKKIINSCIYGVDINPEAAEVAKLSLSLRLIDQYQPQDYDSVGLLGSQILKGVGVNIRCGNSLVGADFEGVFPEISENISELQATNAFDWEQSFPEVFEKGGFDYIVGNPPYVEVKNYSINLPYMALYIKRTYASCKNGKMDLAIPFIERGISILNENGRLGYIIQKRFFKTEYGKGIRKLLTSQNLLNGVLDYSETDLFQGYITYVAILVCDRNTQCNTNVWYLKSTDAKGQLIPAKTLTDTPWNFENAPLNALRIRLAEKLGTLNDICKIKVGIQTLWNDAYQLAVDKIENGLIYGHSKIDDSIIVEKEACRPLICNENFAPLTRRAYSTYVLFPYAVNDQRQIHELDFNEYENLYPKAAAYLNKHRELIWQSVEILPQKNRAYNTTHHWHLFTRANNHGATYPKICIPMTSQYPQASVLMDPEAYCDNANMFFGKIEPMDETSLYALAGIINSTIFNTLARSIANPQQGGYYKFNKQFLDPVPFPVHAFTNGNRDIKRIAKIAKQIESLNEQIKTSLGSPISGLMLALREKWSELDKICNKLYGITDASDKTLLYSNHRNDRNPYGQEGY